MSLSLRYNFAACFMDVIPRLILVLFFIPINWNVCPRYKDQQILLSPKDKRDCSQIWHNLGITNLYKLCLDRILTDMTWPSCDMNWPFIWNQMNWTLLNPIFTHLKSNSSSTLRPSHSNRTESQTICHQNKSIYLKLTIVVDTNVVVDIWNNLSTLTTRVYVLLWQIAIF